MQALTPQLQQLADSFHAAPLQQLDCGLLQRKSLTLLIKRYDLLHPHLGGNKWFKLKYNLDACLQQGCKRLLTFGGAWSNHVHAVAAAGELLGIETVAVIRGEPVDNSNLAYARQCGMQLEFISRQQYREKVQPEFIASLRQRYGDFTLVPEGGSNALALQGVADMVSAIDTPFDVICCACGTGATLAGIAGAIDPKQHATGFAVLKADDYLQREVRQWLATDRQNWHIEFDYHFGGYARASAELLSFMQAFDQRFAIELDVVYTAKMLYGLFDLVRRDRFDPGTTLVAVHSGGTQGNAGFQQQLSTAQHADITADWFDQ